MRNITSFSRVWRRLQGFFYHLRSNQLTDNDASSWKTSVRVNDDKFIPVTLHPPPPRQMTPPTPAVNSRRDVHHRAPQGRRVQVSSGEAARCKAPNAAALTGVWDDETHRSANSGSAPPSASLAKTKTFANSEREGTIFSQPVSALAR